MNPQKKIKEIKEKAKRIKESTKKLRISDLLPNIKIHKHYFIESDLYIKELVKRKKEEKTKELKKVLTKSENIITKLRKLKEKAIKSNDNITSQDIDWIISKINDQNLYDIDTNEFHLTINDETNHNGIEYLKLYSQIENQNLV